ITAPTYTSAYLIPQYNYVPTPQKQQIGPWTLKRNAEKRELSKNQTILGHMQVTIIFSIRCNLAKSTIVKHSRFINLGARIRGDKVLSFKHFHTKSPIMSKKISTLSQPSAFDTEYKLFCAASRVRRALLPPHRTMVYVATVFFPLHIRLYMCSFFNVRERTHNGEAFQKESRPREGSNPRHRLGSASCFVTDARAAAFGGCYIYLYTSRGGLSCVSAGELQRQWQQQRRWQPPSRLLDVSGGGACPSGRIPGRSWREKRAGTSPANPRAAHGFRETTTMASSVRSQQQHQQHFSKVNIKARHVKSESSRKRESFECCYRAESSRNKRRQRVRASTWLLYSEQAQSAESSTDDKKCPTDSNFHLQDHPLWHQATLYASARKFTSRALDDSSAELVDPITRIYALCAARGRATVYTTGARAHRSTTHYSIDASKPWRFIPAPCKGKEPYIKGLHPELVMERDLDLNEHILILAEMKSHREKPLKSIYTTYGCDGLVSAVAQLQKQHCPRRLQVLPRISFFQRRVRSRSRAYTDTSLPTSIDLHSPAAVVARAMRAEAARVFCSRSSSSSSNVSGTDVVVRNDFLITRSVHSAATIRKHILILMLRARNVHDHTYMRGPHPAEQFLCIYLVNSVNV
ncbi:unnamed protein product, partial [Trichogramma brassicae]